MSRPHSQLLAPSCVFGNKSYTISYFFLCVKSPICLSDVHVYSFIKRGSEIRSQEVTRVETHLKAWCDLTGSKVSTRDRISWDGCEQGHFFKSQMHPHCVWGVFTPVWLDHWAQMLLPHVDSLSDGGLKWDSNCSVRAGRDLRNNTRHSKDTPPSHIVTDACGVTTATHANGLVMSGQTHHLITCKQQCRQSVSKIWLWENRSDCLQSEQSWRR